MIAHDPDDPDDRTADYIQAARELLALAQESDSIGYDKEAARLSQIVKRLQPEPQETTTS